MQVKLRRFPEPIDEDDLQSGDLIVMTTNDGSELGFMVEVSADQKLVFVLATLSGDPDVDGVPRLTSPHGSLARIAEPVMARPLVGKQIALPGDHCSGALTLGPKGAFIRVDHGTQVAYFDIATGKRGDTGSPRVYYPEWALAFDGEQERVIAAIGTPAKI